MITVRHNSIRPFPWLILIVTVSFALVPWWTDNVSLRENLILAALDITLGYAGYVNFGNIVMFGLGGYFGVYLVSVWHWPILVATLVGGIAVSAIAYVFGLGILRLRGAYFALATIGVNETVSVFVTNFDPWGGASGLYLSLDAYTPLGGPGRALWIVYFLMVAVMGLSLALSYAIRRSKFGLGLLAIGENEDAAAILGVPTRIYKAMVYSVSAFLPAVAGSLYFFKSGIIEPTGAFDLTTSIETIVMVMLGGQGTVAGPVIGAFLYEELRGYLLTAEAFSHFQLVIAGLLLLLIVLFAPSGLMGFVHLKLPFTRRWLE
jgi:branched-chain amino acid transport system permease protein